MAGKRTHIEVYGKGVHFAIEVQYFEDKEFPTELEVCVKEVDEETDACRPPDVQTTFPSLLKKKKKYYYFQMDSSEDELNTEENKTEGQKEEIKIGNENLAEDGVDIKASTERKDGEGGKKCSPAHI